MRLSATRPSAIGNRKPTAFNPVKHFGSDLLWHFGTPDDWWQAFQRALGPELVVNGGFDSAAGWVSTPGGWVVSGGLANNTTSADLTASIQLTQGATYAVSYQVTAYTSGIGVGVHNSSGGFQRSAITRRTSAGRYVETLVASATGSSNNLIFNSTGPLSIDNISVREIDLSKVQLWQDPAGTLPVTGPGQTWGLLLDAKDGLASGVELATNGDFSDGTTGWTAGGSPTFTVSSGVATVTNSLAAESNISKAILTIGKWYEVSITRTAAVTGVGRISVGGASFALVAGANRVLALAATVNFSVSTNSAAAGASVSIDNISVREIPGYHASQAGAPSRPLFTCRYNQLTNSAFTGGGATPTGWTRVVATGTSAPFSTQPDGSVVYRQTGFVGERPFFEQILTETLPVGYVKKYRLTVFAVTTGSVQAQHLLNRSGSATTTVQYFKDGVACPSTEPITGPCVLEAVWTVTVAGSIYFRCGPGCSGPMPDAFSVDFGCPDLRLAIHATTGKPYQRVTSATDMDTEGFPFYSWTDGIDDWASTPVIPLGTMGVSALTVVDGVTKLSDAATGMVWELSTAANTTNGTMYLAAPVSTFRYALNVRGTVAVVATTESTSFNSPHKAVVITEGDITNDIARLTVNNGAPVLTSTDQGAGTFTDQPMYLFRRGGTSLPFGGPWHGSTGVKGIRTDSEKRRLSAYYNRNVKGY